MALFNSAHSENQERKRFVDTFFGQVLLVFIGATISIIFTLGTAYLMDRREREASRRLSALMVMSNIESFARTLEEHANLLATNDSIATWLISKPIEDLELMPEKELNSLIDQATNLMFMYRDKSAENIFSNNIETWKSVGNVQFIDGVGQCFSAMNTVEEYWNKRVNDANQTILDIKDHPRKYEGSTLPIKILRDEKVRRTLTGIHHLKTYLTYVAATMRYHNQYNMKYIGITEQDVMEYTNTRLKSMDNTNDAPDFSDFYSEPITVDSLFTLRELELQLDSLKGL